MKHIGVVRKIDELGRIVVPKEVRNTLDISSGDAVAIGVEGSRIVLEKFDRQVTKDELFDRWKVEVGEAKARMLYEGASLKVVMSISDDEAQQRVDRM
ncbi:AbrB/MazE/SpoVT family DNA-binding domain-containing protein [Geomicrobium sp. JCM 19038]|uniref:AbrB/MazE/SpoVT family DNA-binding domain-containing protein n=1 Tax=Geomicrobium sp. JCM 19038 TaxID=1460635 RepID=UPI00045F175E|nr:AbrB/MazE/SpoVT family DNA-binding domain-containing protein [Geomicrobium sp. JCM 19038]GAK08978.1 transition state regulatory protein AbrB [Geomicrobium sp. JCM 19038]